MIFFIIENVIFYNEKISNLLDLTKSFNISCNRVFSILDNKTFDKEAFGKKHLNNIKGNVEFKNVTIINQSPYIFNMSIRDNLKLVKEDLTDEEMIESCKLACLDEFIDSLPNKYDTIVGENGVVLSGGQKQRLAIARALIQKTKIILFDEATSSLDNETQSEIQKAILNLKNQYSILIIAHRLSTIINCDKIMILENGKVTDQGNHKELLDRNNTYKTLYQTEILK